MSQEVQDALHARVEQGRQDFMKFNDGLRSMDIEQSGITPATQKKTDLRLYKDAFPHARSIETALWVLDSAYRRIPHSDRDDAITLAAVMRCTHRETVAAFEALSHIKKGFEATNEWREANPVALAEPGTRSEIVLLRIAREVMATGVDVDFSQVPNGQFSAIVELNEEGIHDEWLTDLHLEIVVRVGEVGASWAELNLVQEVPLDVTYLAALAGHIQPWKERVDRWDDLAAQRADFSKGAE